MGRGPSHLISLFSVRNYSVFTNVWCLVCVCDCVDGGPTVLVCVYVLQVILTAPDQPIYFKVQFCYPHIRAGFSTAHLYADFFFIFNSTTSVTTIYSLAQLPGLSLSVERESVLSYNLSIR